ncbi:MAG: Lrp/AsnC ligand binding domain-containing protein [Halobacteria archaeon]
MPFLIVKTDVRRERDVAAELAKNTKVSEVYIITGEFDILARIEAKDSIEAIDFVSGVLRGIEGIKETRLIFEKRIK